MALGSAAAERNVTAAPPSADIAVPSPLQHLQKGPDLYKEKPKHQVYEHARQIIDFWAAALAGRRFYTKL